MYFTKEDLIKIEQWLQNRAIKDTDFEKAKPIRGSELIPIIQDNKNKIISVCEIIGQLPFDFYNVTDRCNKDYDCIIKAASDVPCAYRKLGLVITFRTSEGKWMLYQFKGTSLEQWKDPDMWVNVVEEALKGLVINPDVEIDYDKIAEIIKTLLEDYDFSDNISEEKVKEIVNEILKNYEFPNIGLTEEDVNSLIQEALKNISPEIDEEKLGELVSKYLKETGGIDKETLTEILEKLLEKYDFSEIVREQMTVWAEGNKDFFIKILQPLVDAAKEDIMKALQEYLQANERVIANALARHEQAITELQAQ